MKPHPYTVIGRTLRSPPETAEVDSTLSGGPLPPTPHPITLHATFTVKNGRITRLLDYVSPQDERSDRCIPQTFLYWSTSV